MTGKTWVADKFFYRDGHLFWKESPKYDIPAGTEAGSSHSSGYWEIGCDGKSWLRHKLIFALFTGEWPDMIDHEDQDRTNDRFENLRPSTKILNGHNSDVVRGLIPYRGVSYDNGRRKYASYMRYDHKRKFLGYFKSAEEASDAYQKYRKEVVSYAR